MSELRQIVALWRTAKARQEEVCLATVVRVEGSSYRQPGARMLLTRSGQRAGTISGGCLEAEVTKKAWWLTENGAALQRYSSFFDDDSPAPYGLGCGGVVHVLLERGAAAHAALDALEQSLSARIPFVIVTDTIQPATLLVQPIDGAALFSRCDEALATTIKDLTSETFNDRRSRYASLRKCPDEANLFVEYLAPPTALTIFGAGDDAKPLTEFAHKLGWHVTVADGRSHLARAERFPTADHIAVLNYADPAPLRALPIGAGDAAVLLTHSYEQDQALLRELLSDTRELDYLGVLGPRQRTQRLIAEVASTLSLSPEECMARLHAPVGFDIGAHTPESIALSIITEIFAISNGRDGLSLNKSSRSRNPISTTQLHV
jgi:xanthine dehydrogenase accessory factor